MYWLFDWRVELTAFMLPGHDLAASGMKVSYHVIFSPRACFEQNNKCTCYSNPNSSAQLVEGNGKCANHVVRLYVLLAEFLSPCDH